jgi:hypothetical protein
VSLKVDLTVPIEQLGTFFSANGRSDSAHEITEQLRFLAPWQRRVQLNYVMHTAAQAPPALEVELCCTGVDEGTVGQRAELLQRLASLGLASASKAEALLTLLAKPAVTDARGQWVARNWYLKVRFEAARPVSAKAYVGLTQRSQATA